jgi:DNA helicase II / ATP-dependent DNA helicase PcrA
MQFSPFQKAIFEHIAQPNNPTGAIIEAVAGSGKTTTIVEGIKHIPFGENYIFLAFNKAIAEELKRRGVANACTFHSLGYRALPTGTKLDQNKSFRLQDTFLTDEQKEEFGMDMRRLASLAKNILVFDYGSQSMLESLIETYDIPTSDAYTLAKLTVVLLEKMKNERQKIDFDDMLWHPIIHKHHFETYDNVFVDEAQDTNNLQRHILGKIVRGKVYAVGDPYQAIYGFRGANFTAMDTLRDFFKCDTLPLHVSYRCPSEVVRAAQHFVPHILSADGAPTGVVRSVNSPDINFFREQNAILCRNTAPLIRLAYQLLANRIACFVAGRDLGKGLTIWIKKLGLTADDSIEVMWQRVDAWKKREEAKPSYSEQKVQDKIDCLEALAEGHECVGGVLETIDKIFSDNEIGIRLSTIHRSKGLEWKNVALLRPDLLPSKYARTEEELRQEKNLSYVALTRAQHTFSYIQ